MENVISTPPLKPLLPHPVELGRGARRAARFITFLAGKFIRVENKDIIKNVSDPAIFAFNHNNSYEVLLAPTCLMHLRRWKKISFIIDWMYGRIPVLKWLFEQIDPIYVYNKPSRFKFMNKARPHGSGEKLPVYRECIRYLRSNKSIGIFPEGKRNKNPVQLKRGRTGIGRIALESGAPVVPIGIDFPGRVEKNKIPAWGTMILRAGEPLEFPDRQALLSRIDQQTGIDPHSRMKALNFLAAEVTHSVMSRISELSGKTYPFPRPEPPEEVKGLLNLC